MVLMKLVFVSLLIFGIFLFPSIGLAAGIVPCDGPDCQACDFVDLGNNVIRWIVGIMSPLCALVIAYAGFRMVTAGGNMGQIESAKDMIWNALIGFVILLSAWLVIDTVLKMLVSGGTGSLIGFGPWHRIECVLKEPYSQAPVPTPATFGTSPLTGCTTSCVSFQSGIPIKNGGMCGPAGARVACTISSEIATQVTSLDTALDKAGLGWEVTEAYPPSVNHQNVCHRNGTCIDANCVSGPTRGCSASQIKTFVESARSAGLRAEYEVKTQTEKDTLTAGGVNPSDIRVVSAITAPHFSVYKGGN